MMHKTSLSLKLEKQRSTSRSLAARSSSKPAKPSAETEDELKVSGTSLPGPPHIQNVTSEGKLIYLKNHKKWAKYLRGKEEALTEEELKKRKKQHFLNKLFYKKLCTLVDRINTLQSSAQSAQKKAMERRRVRQEEMKKIKEQYKRRVRELKERELKSKQNPQSRDANSPENGNEPAGSFLSLLNSRTMMAKPRGLTVVTKHGGDMRSASSKKDPMQSSRNLGNASHKDDFSYVSLPSSRKVLDNSRAQARLKKSQTKMFVGRQSHSNQPPRRSTTENFDHQGLMMAYKARARLTEAKPKQAKIPSPGDDEKTLRKGNVDLISINSIDSSSERESSEISSHSLSNSSKRKSSARRKSQKPSSEFNPLNFATPQPPLGKTLLFHVVDEQDSAGQESKKERLPCTREDKESESNEDEIVIIQPPKTDVSPHLKPSKEKHVVGASRLGLGLGREVFMSDLRPSFGQIFMRESFQKRLATLEEKYGGEQPRAPMRKRKLKPSVKRNLNKPNAQQPPVEVADTASGLSALNSYLTSPMGSPLDFARGLNLKSRMTKISVGNDTIQEPKKQAEDHIAIHTNDSTNLKRRTNRIFQQTLQDDSPPLALATTSATKQPLFFSFDASSQILRTSEEATEACLKESRTSKNSTWLSQQHRLGPLKAGKQFAPILKREKNETVFSEGPVKAQKQFKHRSRQVRPQTAMSIKVFNGDFPARQKSGTRRYEDRVKRPTSKAAPQRILIQKDSDLNLDMVTPSTINLEHTLANSSSNYQQTAPRTKSQQGQHLKDVKSSISSLGPHLQGASEMNKEVALSKRLSMAGRRGFTGRVEVKKSSVVAASHQWALC